MSSYESNNLLILDRLLFEYLNKSETNPNHYDDARLRRLNAILSNIPYNMLKQSHDAYQKKVKVENRTNVDLKYTTAHQATGKTKTDLKFYNHFNVNNNNNNIIQSNNFLDQLKKTPNSNHIAQTAHSHADQTPASHVRSSYSPTLSTTSNPSTTSIIVIHVCDETKQIKKDFTCPRDLLLKEMKYFTNNLNLNGAPSSITGGSSSTISSSSLYKRLDEMDISVHCDVNIFDWLMRYVKRNLKEPDPAAIDSDYEYHSSVKTGGGGDDQVLAATKRRPNHRNKEPKLEINNCISILISSDFLVMGDLVDKCILFMIEHFNQLLQLPCNMNTINDRLITKIAAFIRPSQLEDLVDKKDKFKTKLFMKKIEFLFDYERLEQQFDRLRRVVMDTFEDMYSMCLGYENDANTLFKCKICSRIMTQRQSSYIKCELGILDKYGNFNYFHVYDDKFDVNHFVLDLKERLKTWQNVYWFLWALIKCAKCQTCKEWFRFVDLNKCALNENAECYVHGRKRSIYFTSASTTTHTANDNNNEQVKQINCICRFRDHSIVHASFAAYYETTTYTGSNTMALNQAIIDDLLVHKNIICYGNGTITINNRGVDGTMAFCNIYENNYRMQISANGNNEAQIFVTNFFLDSITGKHISFFNKTYIDLLSLCNPVSSSLLPDGNTLSAATPATAYPNDITAYLRAIYDLDPLNVFNSCEFLGFLKADVRKKWDSTRQARWNQDNQREDDTKRFREIVDFLHLFKLKVLQEKTSAPATRYKQQQQSQQQRDYQAGYYCRIENDWRQRQTQSTTNTTSFFSQNSINSTSNPSTATNSANQTTTTGYGTSTTNSTFSNYPPLNTTSSAQSNSSGYNSINNSGSNSNKLINSKIRSSIAPIPPIASSSSKANTYN
jgi:hypothetical protein